MTKWNKYLTGFLGISMFFGGLLKFIDPFKTWYSTQIIESQLPLRAFAYWSGQLGEIVIGAFLLYALFFGSKWTRNTLQKTIMVTHSVIIIMMIVAVYVHLQPNVPADVLPMGIKAPYIPIGLSIVAALNIYMSDKNMN